MNECMKTYPDLYPESVDDNPDSDELEKTSENNVNTESTDGQIVEAKS